MMGFEGLVPWEFRNESEYSSSLSCSNIKLGFVYPRKTERNRGYPQLVVKKYGGVIVKFLVRGRHFIWEFSLSKAGGVSWFKN